MGCDVFLTASDQLFLRLLDMFFGFHVLIEKVAIIRLQLPREIGQVNCRSHRPCQFMLSDRISETDFVQDFPAILLSQQLPVLLEIVSCVGQVPFDLNQLFNRAAVLFCFDVELNHLHSLDHVFWIVDFAVQQISENFGRQVTGSQSHRPLAIGRVRVD